MDPVSAIGVAAAALQFLDFGLEILKLCREIRDNADNATNANREMAQIMPIMKEFKKELDVKVQNADHAGRRIAKLARDCLQKYDELLDILNKIRGPGGKTTVKALEATYRALRERKTIEKIQRSLQTLHGQLDSAMIQDIRNRFNLVELEQKRMFNTLTINQHALLSQLTNQRTTFSLKSDDLRHSVDALKQQVATKQGQADIRGEIRLLDTTVKRLVTTTSRQDLLRSLFYPDHAQRRETVKAPWGETFDWIFDDKLDMRPDISNYVTWLRSDSPVYWISGKPASGKSTLMAFIFNDHRATQLLQEWAGTCQLCILSFFFWRAGSNMQKSVCGFLRAVLYQLLDIVEDAFLKDVLTRFPLSRELPTWTEIRLVSLLRVAVEVARQRQVCLCLFLDGLDELQGDTDDVLDLLFDLQNVHADHIKLCIASRPEPRLADRLSLHAQIHMHEVNENDINTVVTEKLESVTSLASADRELLARDIMDRADGVFLWASLVANSIKEGACEGDDLAIFRRRVAETPPEMEDLFRQMLSRVDKVQLKELASFFRVMRQTQKLNMRPTVPLITIFHGPELLESYSKLAKRCAQVALRLKAYSKGLLQLEYFANADSLDENMPYFIVPQLDADNTDGLAWHSLEDQKRLVEARIRTVGSSFSREVLKWCLVRTSWIHRSAYDFVFDDRLQSFIDVEDALGDDDIILRLLSAQVRILITAPTTKKNSGDMLYTNIMQFLEAIKALPQSTEVHAHTLIDHVRELLDCYTSVEHGRFSFSNFAYRHLSQARIPAPLSLRQMNFWLFCLENDMTQYVCRYLPPVVAHAHDHCISPYFLDALTNTPDLDALRVDLLEDANRRCKGPSDCKDTAYRRTKHRRCFQCHLNTMSAQEFRDYLHDEAQGNCSHDIALVGLLYSAWEHWSREIVHLRYKACLQLSEYVLRTYTLFHSVFEAWHVFVPLHQWEHKSNHSRLRLLASATWIWPGRLDILRELLRQIAESGVVVQPKLCIALPDDEGYKSQGYTSQYDPNQLCECFQFELSSSLANDCLVLAPVAEFPHSSDDPLVSIVANAPIYDTLYAEIRADGDQQLAEAQKEAMLEALQSLRESVLHPKSLNDKCVSSEDDLLSDEGSTTKE